ncbi:MAG: hypothetical protein EOO90_27050 [Pedobacter sp.]|nr:MAG: hypothetical protein EOO90_27050 [Pedobacter sp.]
MKNLPIILLLISCSFCVAQTKKPSFEKVLDYYCAKSTSDKIYDTPQNSVHIYSLAISFNEEGLIDTLYFPDKINPETRDIFHLDNRKVKLFKTIKIPFKEYANKVLIIPMYHFNAKDSLVDYKFNFLKDFINIFPKINSPKPIVLHQPIVQDFVRHIN